VVKTNMIDTIESFRGEYSWLSNFVDVKITLNGITYPSVEHAYMSAKCDSADWRFMCSSGNYTAGEIKKLSKEVSIRHDWEKIKTKVMTECLIQKFNQEPFRTKLINTNDSYIQEGNHWNDKFWGVCLKTNEGLNYLGKLIMVIRTKLK